MEALRASRGPHADAVVGSAMVVDVAREDARDVTSGTLVARVILACTPTTFISLYTNGR